jgi:SLOG cluster2
VAAEAPEPRLRADALKGVRVGVSVSESRELRRLGLMEEHLRLALGEVSRVVLRAGASLVYGGHLRPGGYTTFLASELDRYGRSDQPIQLIVGWSEHRSVPLSELTRHRQTLGLKGAFTYLDASGDQIDAHDGRGEKPEPITDDVVETSLTGLRRFLTSVTDARILIGGMESDFKGRMPGVIEEALLAIGARQPLFLAGGFGGATASVAQVACNQEERWPPRDASRDVTDSRVEASLGEVREAIVSSRWSIIANGLSLEENLRLVASHRPSEIASLVAIGLSRAFAS